MKVAYLSDLLGPHDYRFLKSLSARGHEVTLITYADNESLNRKNFINSGFDVRDLKNIKIIHTPQLSLERLEGTVKKRITSSKIVSLYYFLRKLWHLKKTLKEISPDIIFAVWVQTSGFLVSLSGFHPLVTISWGSDILIDANLSLKLKTITKFTLKKSDFILCDAKIMKRKILELVSINPEKIIIIPYGIDINFFNINYNGDEIRKVLGWEDKMILISNRTFRPVYGLEYFIKSLPFILDRHKNVRIIFIGDGPLKEELYSLADKLGINNYIYWAGYIDKNMMPQYLCASDIYISCPLSDSTSVSLLEAMGCSLPVIVTDCEANLEWITNGINGFIVPVKNVGTISEKINLLLGNDALRKKMGQENEKLIRNRANWEKNFSFLESKCKINATKIKSEII